VTDEKQPEHPEWPPQGEHLWGAWMNKTGLPKPVQYRTCVHPACKAVDERKHPSDHRS
jgi:hypothetical protein